MSLRGLLITATIVAASSVSMVSHIECHTFSLEEDIAKEEGPSFTATEYEDPAPDNSYITVTNLDRDDWRYGYVRIILGEHFFVQQPFFKRTELLNSKCCRQYFTLIFKQIEVFVFFSAKSHHQ